MAILSGMHTHGQCPLIRKNVTLRNIHESSTSHDKVINKKLLISRE